MKKIYLIFFLFLFVVTFFSNAQEKIKNVKHHAFSGTLRFGAEAGATLGYTDYSDVRPDVVGRGVLEYFFPTSSIGSFGIKGFFSAGYVGGKDERKTPKVFRSAITRLGGGISYTFSIKDAVFPYVFVGASYGWINPYDENRNNLDYPPNREGYDRKEENYHVEGGIHFLLSDAISLNINAGAEFSPKDFWDNQARGKHNDMLIQVLGGLSYSLFTQVDTDGDGVVDSKDQCSETPMGVKVDEFGCPIDSDNDGVPDYQDKCPNTKAGLDIDEVGCPVDEDADGVPDKLDKCPNTPKDAKVNEFGCPDTDGDGVFDNDDKCLDTPKGAPVDDKGCPKDSDGDGVPDYKDECPNTPAGDQVDLKGCTKVEVREATLSGDTNFEFNKATLLPTAYVVLDELAITMKETPSSRWRIEGHTDSKGSESYNMTLSRKRAEAIVNYLTGRGIERSRFEIVPLGESQPIADNKTEEGRAMNRRVEIKIIDSGK